MAGFGLVLLRCDGFLFPSAPFAAVCCCGFSVGFAGFATGFAGFAAGFATGFAGFAGFTSSFKVGFLAGLEEGRDVASSAGALVGVGAGFAPFPCGCPYRLR